MQELSNFIDEVTGSNIKNLRRDRPYNGQMHTDTGERGKQIVSDVTMRDLRDCLLRSFFLCSGHISYERYEEANKGEGAQLCDNDLYGWNLDDIDPVALMQNFTCEVERIMGIFPNVPDDFATSTTGRNRAPIKPMRSMARSNSVRLPARSGRSALIPGTPPPPGRAPARPHQNNGCGAP